MKATVYIVMAYDNIDFGMVVAVTADKQEAESVKEFYDTDEDVAYTIISPHTVIISSQMLTGDGCGEVEKSKSKTDTREF